MIKKKIYVNCFLCLLSWIGWMANATGQKSINLKGYIQIGQYSVGIAKPNFEKLHPGIQLGLVHNYNNSKKHNISQSLGIGFMQHSNVQNAGFLTTELFYKYTTPIGISISPLVLGGGYTYSVLDQETFFWDESEKKYIRDKWPAENNWHIILGTSLGIQFGKDKAYTLTFDYRLMVQGIIMKSTVPVIVYTPLRLGLVFPILNK